MLEWAVLFRAFTPCRHWDTGIGSEFSTISIMLVFCTEADVLRDLAVKRVLELLVSNDATSLLLQSIRLETEDYMQETVCWDEKSVIFARLKCKDLLAHGTGVQVVFTP